jgi:hypothetical protein
MDSGISEPSVDATGRAATLAARKDDVLKKQRDCERWRDHEQRLAPGRVHFAWAPIRCVCWTSPRSSPMSWTRK